jgi:hypothetical protein
VSGEDKIVSQNSIDEQIKRIEKAADEAIKKINEAKKIEKAADEAIKKIEKAGDKHGNRWVHTDIYNVWTVLMWTVLSAAGLMVVALVVQKFDHFMINATKDVLPLATGLVGFAGGVVTAIFGKEAAAAAKTGEGNKQ